MGEIFAIIMLVIAIVRGIYWLIRWAIRSVKKLSSPGPTYTPVQSMTSPGPTQPARFSSNLVTPAPMTRPPLQSGFPPPVVTREATSADFRAQEAALIADEDQPRSQRRRSDPAPSPTPSPSLTPLFGTTPDLIRGLILQELLGPPLARRRRQSDTGESQ